MINHTVNNTTVKLGQSIATVICDTVDKTRITTLELVYPRYIHSEFNTHRMFSRNASSSRATPLDVTIHEVLCDPVFFDFVGKNQSGMVADMPLPDDELENFRLDWEMLGQFVASRVREMSSKYDIHKQTLNRALEPWLRIRTLVTATEWDNFFNLRISDDAQPEIKKLAMAMCLAMEKSYPQDGTAHLPYITELEKRNLTPYVNEMSVARCARVSYARLDGKENNLTDDINLYKRLLKNGHLSPFEHVAFSKDGRHANFYGWRSLRNSLEN